MQIQNSTQNPIDQIVQSAVVNIKKAAESNTILGQPFVNSDGSTILPISQVSFAFVAGGGEYDKKAKPKDKDVNFAGGSLGGAVLSPMGFLISNHEGIKLIKFDEESSLEKVIDVAGSFIEVLKSK